MNKKFVCILVAALLLPAVLSAQSPASGQDYWMDDEGRFHQVIRWTRTNALYYDVELERRDNTGRWLLVETQRTEDTYLELILPPGAYRFRVHTYNVLERLVGTSDWTGIRVYEAKAPAADALSLVEIPRDETVFVVTITGDDLVEEAEVYLISRKKGAEPIEPLSVSYSFDESWIRVEFSSEQVSRGTYDLVITNPGGMSQTLDEIKLKFVRPQPDPGIAGAFTLDNTRGWSLGLQGFLGPRTELVGEEPEYKKGTSEILYGAALNYTFLERYKNYGKFIWLPNSFYAELSYLAKNKYMDLFQDGSGSPYIEIDQQSITLEFGALYKIRLGRAQRFLFHIGMGMGLGLDFYDATEYSSPVSPIETDISGTALFFNFSLKLGILYRITPVWAVDLGITFGGSEAFMEESDLQYGIKPSMASFSLGGTYRGFY